jgi:hypothetical protein
VLKVFVEFTPLFECRVEGEVKFLLRGDAPTWAGPSKFVDPAPSVRADIDFFQRLRDGLDTLTAGSRALLEDNYAPRESDTQCVVFSTHTNYACATGMTLEEFVAGLDYVSFEDVRSVVPVGLLDAKGRLLVGPKVC